MKNAINWKAFIILLSSSLVSIACVFPYIITLQGDLLAKAGVSIPFLFFAQFLQSFVLFAIAIFFGLLLAKKTGLKLIFLTENTKRGVLKNTTKNVFTVSVLCGILSGILIYIADFLFKIPSVTTHRIQAPIWQTLLASFYGGITEEILMRLFLMTLFVWIGMKLFKLKQPSNFGIIVPIFLAAIIFGLGHLPITAALTEITASVVARAVLLNSIGGIIFGLLYWKIGFESAIIAHFTTDIILLTVLPLLINA